MENMEFPESVSDYALSRMQGVKSPDKNFRVMTKTSFRNKTSRRSNSVGGDRAHRVIVAESYSGRLASYREHVCCWNKKGGEKRWKNEEREI